MSVISSDDFVNNGDLEVEEIAGVVLRIVAGFIKFDGSMKPIKIVKKFLKLLPCTGPEEQNIVDKSLPKINKLL